MYIEDEVKPPAALLMTLGILGIFGNSNIIWATYRKRSLRSTCSIFIAITAFGDVLHQFSHIILVYNVFINTSLSPAWCFKLQVIPTLGSSVSSVMLFMTSIDRLVCVYNPKFYEDLHKHCIFLIGTSITLVISLTFSLWSYVAMSLEPRICGALQDMPDNVKQYYFTLNLGLISFTVMLYMAIWTIVRRKNYRKSKQMLKSITAISLCICSGWLITMISGVVISTQGFYANYAAALYAGSIMNISIALNYPLLFALSQEYRVAFSEQIRLLTCNTISLRTKIYDSNIRTSMVDNLR